MSGHGPLTEWCDYTTRQLKKILSLCSQLEKLGINQDEDFLFSIAQEIFDRTGVES